MIDDSDFMDYSIDSDIGSSGYTESYTSNIGGDVNQDTSQIIDVDEIVDRISEGLTKTYTEEERQAQQEMAAAFASGISGEMLLQSAQEEEWRSALMDEILEIKDDLTVHPLLTTEFSDYTVSEGILLLILLGCILRLCLQMLRGGFAWLEL